LTKHHLEQACSTFSMVQETSAKYGLHVANMQFNIQHEEWINIHIII